MHRRKLPCAAAAAVQNVSGMVRPGQLTCLMGASGAGKTTLLDVIAQRKTQGIIEGEIRLNGHPKQEGVWRPRERLRGAAGHPHRDGAGAGGC